MPNTLKHKQAATASKVPLTTDLALGELAVNTYDGRVFLKKDVSGTQSIVEVGSDASRLTSGTVASARLPATADMNGRIAVEKNGTLVGTRRAINLIEGTNVTLTVADDSPNEEVDVTINAARTASIEFPAAAALYPATNFGQFKSVSGTNFPVESIAFDATTEESVFFKFAATGYTSGNLTVRIRWYADTATSGGVTWGVRLAAITPDTDSQNIETKAFATEQEVNDTHLATTGQRLHEAVLTLSNLDSLAARDDVTLRLARKVANANDTMTGDALVVGLIVEYAS